VKNGIGTLVLDARRDGTELMKGHTFPPSSPRKVIRENPAAARQPSRPSSRQKALREDPARTRHRPKFPPAGRNDRQLIRRDAPFYDSAISEDRGSMNQFARGLAAVQACGLQGRRLTG
jgi:hypothetical protein